ncbi:Ras-related protein [Takifugu flavidus]|uniref:Ras-related protein n=1 Tax=Takifugu flavidus TaxID=433684 RepID=A0A5C6PNK0_9TELE|nr:Ras-related protein [Takifugu flavidus]
MNTQRDPVATQLSSDTLGRPVRTLRVKMVLLGGSGVGKSSLALRFVRSEFRSTVPTVGCAYMTHMIHLRDVSLRFEIWDTAGQEKYHSVTPLYYRGAHAALLVYDISKRELEKHYIPGSTVMWLIGNKADLGHARQVSEQEGHSLAADRGLYFIETSALSGDHVDELLQDVAHRVYECVGGQQGGLSEWEEKPCEDLHHRDMSSLLTSCCKS